MSRIITVTNQVELLAALKGATGGEIISLAAGNYGDLNLIDRPSFDLSFSSTVTLISADPANPAKLTGLDVRGADNLSFENITFDYSYEAGQPIWEKPFTVSGSTNVSFASCTFDGDVASGLTQADNGFPTGFGLNVRDSSSITVTDCEISGFYRGVVFSNVDDLEVSDNDLHGIRMDGMNFSAVQGVLIEGNTIHDFARSMGSLDHSDMIQFWTNGTTRPSTDIVIRGNTLDVGDGEYTQSIFMRNDQVDRGIAGAEMFYQNVLIENNVIINGHMHGITVGETNGLTIRSNSVLHSDGASADGVDAAVEIPRISVATASTQVTISNNATASISGFEGQSDWTVRQNAFVQDQDPGAPGWYRDVFVTSSLTLDGEDAGFVARPGGMLHTLGAGAPATLGNGPRDGLDAAFHVTETEEAPNARIFDAASIMGNLPSGTIYQWDFGDGTSARGSHVNHSYSQAGLYEAILTVTLPDGTSDRASTQIGISAPQIVHLESGGRFIHSSNGTETTLATAASIDSAGAVQLGSQGITASINRASLNSVFSSDDVNISFRLNAEGAARAGEVFRLHGSFITSVNSNGELNIRAWSADGDSVTLQTSGFSINDGASHNFNLRLAEGRLSLWVDGNQVSDANFRGGFANSGNHDLTFGNAWGATNFEGDLTAFNISTDHWVESVAEPRLPTTQETTTSLPPPPQPEDLIRLQDDGSFLRTVSGEEAVVSSARAVDADGGVQLGGREVASIGRNHVDQIFQSEDVSISFAIDADLAGNQGEIFRLHGSFVVDVTSRGELRVRAWSSEGDAATLVSTGRRVNDGGAHENEIRLEDGRLSLWVDGTMVSDAEFDGSFANTGRHNLTFGNPWNGVNFVGDLTEFAITLEDIPSQTDVFDSGVASQSSSFNQTKETCIYETRSDARSEEPSSPKHVEIDTFTAFHAIDATQPLI